MKQDLISSISKMTVNGNRLELPQDEQFENYAAVKKCLLDAGGKYKKCGFDFKEDGRLIKDRLVGGEVINDKKKFQFFATPDKLARQLVDMASVEPGDRVLEPSAGQGAISNLIRDLGVACTVVEFMPENVKALKRQNYSVIEGDFLTMSNLGLFDVIVANPPFTKNQDIDHIRHMYKHLKPGGNLVSVASKSWTFGSQKKQVDFRKWLKEVGAEFTEIPPGVFKESGTSVASVIIEIYKG